MTEQLFLNIESDGTPEGTKIIDRDTGKELRGVTNMHIYAHGGNPSLFIDLTFRVRDIALHLNDVKALKVLSDHNPGCKCQCSHRATRFPGSVA